jgi:hypothetical protein
MPIKNPNAVSLLGSSPPVARPLTAVVRGGKMTQVDDGEVDYELVSPNHQFTETSAAVPLASTIKGARLFIASKYGVQALPLVNPDSPLVDNLDDETGEGYNKTLGHKLGLKKAHIGGTIKRVSEKFIDMDDDDGKTTRFDMKQYFPNNKKTYTSETPMVAVGDRVEIGQPIARNNFVDKDGRLAMGKNLTVAFMPAPGGDTFEDAIAVSESAAKKMTSPHLFGFDIEHKHGTNSEKNKFISLFPNKYTNDQLAKIDANGMIKPGVRVNPGDPVLLSFAPRSLSSRDAAMGNLSKVLRNSFQDLSQEWDKSTEGVVAHAVAHRSGHAVKIATNTPLQAGDKVSARSGAKGVISKIIPDDQIIRSKDGTPIDIFINPAAMIGRVNPGMIFESLLGKIAHKHNRRYDLPGFSDDSYRDYVEHELAAHGESDTEDLDDPVTGNTIPKVITGRQFFMKLEHVSDSKQSGRGDGGSDINDQPTKGGEDGCFPECQKIRTAFGTMDIGRICEKRIGVPVFTYSEKLNEWVFRPITDWFIKRSSVDDILTIELEEAIRDWNSSAEHRSKTNTCIHPTKNHWIYTFEGEKKQAQDLKIGDSLVSWGPKPTDDQMSFLYGTMLGDGYSHVDGDIFVCKHSIKQITYLDWKQKVLSGLCATKSEYRERTSKNSATVKLGYAQEGDLFNYGIVSFQDDVLCSHLRRFCYSGPSGKKKLTKEWLSKLDGLAIAAWILDDGSITNKSKKAGKVALGGSVATQCFEREDVEMLRQFLSEKYGAVCWISSEQAKNGPIISFSVEMCKALIQEIAQWIPAQSIPGSKRFLVKQVAKIQEGRSLNSINSVCELSKIPLRIKDIRKFSPDKPNTTEVNVYDFTVQETHSYAAGPVLVSNSKRLGGLQNYALLSHGADQVLKDAHLYRGSSNVDMWRRLRLGESLPAPKVPFVYDKFLNSLKGAGINTKPDADGRLKILALTDKDVDEMAKHEIQNSETISHKDGSPIKGGMMDFSLHGGPAGLGWSKIALDEPMPSPVMEEPIRRLLGITEKQMRGIIAGTDSIGGKKGPQALHDALKAINIDQMIESDRETIRLGRKGKRDEAVRRMNYALGLKKSGLEPSEMMITKIPVIPPAYRPVTVMGNMHLTSDANYLYKDLMSSRDAFRSNREELGDDDLSNERLAIYDSIKAIQGLGDPINIETANKGVKGFIRQIAGVGGPKTGFFASKVIGHPVNAVGRAVIVPNADLNMDQVGIPHKMAWNMFGPFVMRSMVREGMPATEAAKKVEKQDPFALKHLQKVMAERPVMYSRDPALHRFSIMGGMPVLSAGNNIQMSPLVVKPFGADYDGDQMNIHVPVSDESVKEVKERMMPSKNLFGLRGKQVHYLPSQEFTLGIFGSTKQRPKTQSIHFKSKEEAVAAYKAGLIPIDQPITIDD